jgi:putative endonuclease
MSTNTKRHLASIGEALAAEHLFSLGYHIIKRNYYSSRGEIDIIAIDQKEIVIVEVKTRTSHSVKAAEDSITQSKRKKITLSALQFLSDYPQYSPYSVRFDNVIVLYYGDSGTFKIRHRQNAFEPIFPDNYA